MREKVRVRESFRPLWCCKCPRIIEERTLAFFDKNEGWSACDGVGLEFIGWEGSHCSKCKSALSSHIPVMTRYNIRYNDIGYGVLAGWDEEKL